MANEQEEEEFCCPACEGEEMAEMKKINCISIKGGESSLHKYSFTALKINVSTANIC